MTASPEPKDNEMTFPVVASASAQSTLAQQKADFTAEGAPPPGEVSSVSPVTADRVPHFENHSAARVQGRSS